MGILSHPARLVEALVAKHLESGFTVCELGNQFYHGPQGEMLAQSWYERLGCGRYVSIDGNGHATVMADLNRPLNLDDIGTFDVVTDFGTGEHIFNQAQVWETLHDLCAAGGFIIFDRPKAGWNEHCFYNIHETLVRNLAEANEYDIVHLETHGIEGYGELLFGILKPRTKGFPFRYPQQGKYKDRLQDLEVVDPMRKRIKRWHVLESLAKKHGWTRGAEVGVLNGATFFHLLDTCPALSMTAIDNWSTNAPDYGDLTEVGREFARKAGTYGSRARILLGRSAEMAKQVEDGSLDFVFIDADHSQEAVLADIEAWAPKVRTGGAIMGHDIDHASVLAAVHAKFPEQFVRLPDDVWGKAVT